MELTSAARNVATFILYAALSICVLVLLYCVYFYGWKPERYFTNPIMAFLYYALAISATLLMCSLRLGPAHRTRIALSLLSFSLCLYVSELSLALYGYPFASGAQAPPLAAQSSVEFDTRDKLQVIADLETRGFSPSPTINPSHLLFAEKQHGPQRSMIDINGVETLPLTGLANTLTVFCNESGSFVTYERDEHGFHNPKGIWNAARIDIVAVGDSFTQGSCVPSEKNAVALN